MLTGSAIEPLVEDGQIRGYRALSTEFRDPDFEMAALRSQERRRLRRGWHLDPFALRRLRRAALADLRRRIAAMSRHERLRVLAASGRDPASLLE